MSHVMWKPWVLNPIWHSLLAWGLTLLAVCIGPFVMAPSSPFVVGLVFILFAICIFTTIAIVVSVTTYKVAELFLVRLLSLYLALVFIFATTYFWMVVFFDPTKPFEGIGSPWHWLPGTQGRRWTLGDAALTAVDCFHYSTVTITTLGFGDMHPVHWSAKLLTDFEVLAGVGLVAIGLGRFFTNISKRL